MENNPSILNNPAIRITQLRKGLELSGATDERLPLLDELSFCLADIDPANGATVAGELLQLARSIKDDNWIARGCIHAGMYAVIRSRYAHGLRYLKEAWSRLKNSPNHFSEKFHIYRLRGIICSEDSGDQNESIRLLSQALEFATASGCREDVGLTLLSLSESFYTLGQFGNALDKIDGCLKLIAEGSSPGLEGEAFRLLGLIHQGMEDWEPAESRMRKSLDICRQIGNRYGEACAYRGLGLIHSDLHDYDLALTALQKAALLFREMERRRMECLVMAEISRVYTARNEFRSAHAACLRGFELESEIGNRVAFGAMSLAKGELLMAQGNRKDALPLIESALATSCSGGAFYRIALAHQLLTRLYEGVSNFSQALIHHKQFIALRDAILRNETQRKLVALEFREWGRGNVEAGAPVEKEISSDESDEALREMAAISLRLSSTTELLDKLKEQVLGLGQREKSIRKTIGTIVGKIDAEKESAYIWEAFQKQLQYLDRDFLHSLTTRCPGLTAAELRICSLLRMGFSNRETAALLSLSTRTVDTHRTSIRRKLGMEKSEDLTTKLKSL